MSAARVLERFGTFYLTHAALYGYFEGAGNFAVRYELLGSRNSSRQFAEKRGNGRFLLTLTPPRYGELVVKLVRRYLAVGSV